MEENGGRWVVRGSRESHDCINMVRESEELYFVDVLKQRNPDLDLIKLSIGGLLISWSICIYPPARKSYADLRLREAIE